MSELQVCGVLPEGGPDEVLVLARVGAATAHGTLHRTAGGWVPFRGDRITPVTWDPDTRRSTPIVSLDAAVTALHRP